MTDDRADRSVVHRIIRIRVEKWWLQNSGRKHDLVHHRLVIRIHSWGRHSPVGPIAWFADLLQVAVSFKLVGANAVQNEGAAVYLQDGIIEPFVWITDLN